MPTIPYKLKDGTRVSGVTTIHGQNLGWNKEPLMFWANKVGQEGKSHRDVAGKEADAGTCGHALIDAHIKKKKIDTSIYPTEILAKGETCFLNFLEWEKMVNLRIHATEINLVSEVYKFGGTPDCIGYVTDNLALIDWKTGSGVYEDMLLQLAAYKVLWEENNPEMPLTGGFHLLRIGKEDASFHHHHWHSLPEAWEAFQHCLALHNLHKLLKKKV